MRQPLAVGEPEGYVRIYDQGPELILSTPEGEALVEPLSERELEVLHLIADGLANAQIAARLYIEIGTVKRHINYIFGELGVSGRTQAIARGRALKLRSVNQRPVAAARAPDHPEPDVSRSIS